MSASIDTSPYIEKFEKFFNDGYRQELVRLKSQYPQKKSFYFSFKDLEKFDPDFADDMLDDPDNYLEAAQLALLELVGSKIVKFEPHVRMTDLPDTGILIQEIGAAHIRKLVRVEGVVTKRAEVRPKVQMAVYVCDRCDNVMRVPIVKSTHIPDMCDNCQRKGLELDEEKSYFTNLQRAEMQELLERVRGGSPASNIELLLEDDLVNVLIPGDTVEISGIVRIRPIPKHKGVYQKFIEVVNVKNVQKDFEEVELSKQDIKEIEAFAKTPGAFDQIVKSVAPSIYGHTEVKEALVLQVFGGTKGKTLPEGGRIRNDIHILLIGDPGVSKSRLLQYMAMMAPKSIYVSGKSASGAGLTAAAEKDDLGEGWTLKAGALVLASGGMGCLHPETPIYINETCQKIGEIFDENKITKGITNTGLIELNEKTNMIPSFNLNEYLMENSVSNLIRRKYYVGPLLELKFATGFSIKLTPDHKLIDGNTLEWKPANEFVQGEHIIAPLKIRNENKTRYISDLLPEDWFVCLKEERIPLGKLRKEKRYVNLKDKALTFQRGYRKNSIKTAILTPELGYVLGFAYGDGNLGNNKRRGGVNMTQSAKHRKYIKHYSEFWKKSTGKDVGVYKRTRTSKIRNREVASESVTLHEDNFIIAGIYDSLVGKDLSRLHMMPDEVLAGFIAGCMDSDGCISTKHGTKKLKNGEKEFKTIHIEFLLSNDDQKNSNFILSLRRFGCYAKIIRKKSINTVRITGGRDVYKLIKAIKLSVKADGLIKKLSKKLHEVSSVSEKLPAKPVSEITKNIISKLDTSELIQNGTWSTLYAYANSKRQPSRKQIGKILDRCPFNGTDRKQLTKLVNGEYFLEEIVSISTSNYEGYVYDLYVPGPHNFVASGVLVHNCIDEFDKIEKHDQAALHEVMESGSVSVAKAGIVAKFKAETTILAAANPRFGRFDPNQVPAEQFDIPPTLLSRFDLIFPIKDVMDEERDKELAQHILTSHRNAAKAKEGTEEKKIVGLPQEFLRKYVAHARKNIHPVMTVEASEKIKEYYIELRKLGQSQGAFAITPRQIEGLVRLSEASSKVRLDNKVSIEDAERAIRLTDYVIKEIALDRETGKIDIDIIATGQPRSKAEQYYDLVGVIRDLLRHYDQVAKEMIIDEAKKVGMTEVTIRKFLDEMQRKGELFEPKPGFLKFVQKGE